MSCMSECLLRIYEYGPPTNLRTLDPKPYVFTPIPKTVTNYNDILARAQAIIDAMPKTQDNCEGKGCKCVADEVQAKPYPRASQTRTESEWIGRSMIKFDYTIKFTTYTGQCDKVPSSDRKAPPKARRK